MKRNVIVYGLISGLIVTVMMVYSTSRYCATGNFDNGMVYGYTAMLIAFSMIFVGTKNYRDKYQDGVLNFGKAFKVGFLIALIASTLYVITWQVEYHWVFPDFGDKYAAHMIEKAKTSGATAAELAKKTIEMAKFNEMYKKPLFNILLTYAEILPLGVVVSLVSALILKRKVAK